MPREKRVCEVCGLPITKPTERDRVWDKRCQDWILIHYEHCRNVWEEIEKIGTKDALDKQ